MNTLKEFARQKGKSNFLVNGFSEAHKSSEYTKARAFYEKMGFIKSRYLG